MKRIGILGGGQLGMLLAQSIFRMGAEAIIYEPDPLAPGLKQVARSFNNGWTDFDALREFFSLCDAVTYEFENVDSSHLVELEKLKPLLPSARVLKTTQDRNLEKSFVRESQFPHASFELVTDLNQLPAQASRFRYPSILKTTRGGYDGKGQHFLKDERDIETVVRDQATDSSSYAGILEEALDIALECSCIVALSRNGEEVAFPIFENIHKEHILDYTIVPARIPKSVASAIQQLALQAAHALGVKGLLTTEFFLTRTSPKKSTSTLIDGWHILINEFAPRPHNSGHVTLKACTVSQYEALARVLLDIPLAEPEMLSPGSFCMGNLLGDVWLSQQTSDLSLSCLAAHPDVIDVVIYGKHEPRPKRKMGHFVTHAKDPERALASARAFKMDLMQSACHSESSQSDTALSDYR